MDSQTIEVSKKTVDVSKKTREGFDRSVEILEKRGQVVLAGSPWFPKYGSETSDTDRGNLTIENVVKALRMGYKCCYLISHSEDPQDPYTQALQQRLAKEGLADDPNLRIISREIAVYGEARRAAMREAMSGFLPRVVSLQEAEKDLTPFVDRLVEPLLQNGGAAIVTMRRENLRTLPFAQRIGEGIQDSLIHGVLEAAGIPVGERPEDVLNGTRFILNEPVKTKYDREVNPLDLFIRLQFAYDPEVLRQIKESHVYTYDIDRYSATVYFPLVIARELGLDVEEVGVPYVHDTEQTLLEDKDDEGKFRERRISQAKDIVGQNFDLVASILWYKERGRWPQVLWEALDTDNPRPLQIWHFETREWEIVEGKLKKREVVVK